MTIGIDFASKTIEFTDDSENNIEIIKEIANKDT